MKIKTRENVNRLFTGGESEVGFIAYKEHPSFGIGPTTINSPDENFINPI